MDATEAGNSFEICVYGMGEDIYRLLTPQKTVIHIILGYDDSASKEVMTGLLTEKSLKAGDQWYEATLKGKASGVAFTSACISMTSTMEASSTTSRSQSRG
jgi:hypothetical protein